VFVEEKFNVNLSYAQLMVLRKINGVNESELNT